MPPPSQRPNRAEGNARKQTPEKQYREPEDMVDSGIYKDISSLKTTVFGPEGCPDVGLVAVVKQHGKDISELSSTQQVMYNFLFGDPKDPKTPGMDEVMRNMASQITSIKTTVDAKVKSYENIGKTILIFFVAPLLVAGVVALVGIAWSLITHQAFFVVPK
jgi:hypothetical protein